MDNELQISLASWTITFQTASNGKCSALILLIVNKLVSFICDRTKTSRFSFQGNISIPWKKSFMVCCTKYYGIAAFGLHCPLLWPLRDPDWESVSDLGNGGWPNSMKLGEDIHLDELLLNPVLFVFILSSFQFFRGCPLLGSESTEKHPYDS